MREIGKNSARGFSKVIKIPHKNKKKINFVKGLKRKCSLRDEKKGFKLCRTELTSKENCKLEKRKYL